MTYSFADNKKLSVINFLSGPGCGKSTTAAEIFATMKRNNYKVELVHEYAKELVWEQRLRLYKKRTNWSSFYFTPGMSFKKDLTSSGLTLNTIQL